MKVKIKYIIILIIILIIGMFGVNLYKPNKEQVLRGKIEIIVYSDTYDYLSECAERFMELNNKAEVKVKKIYNDKEIMQEINNKNDNVTYIAQIDRSDFEDMKLEKVNYFEEQQDILSAYSKNFSQYRLQQMKYDDISIGIPFTSRPLALYIREDMLNEYGYTRDDINTWDDIISIGKDIYVRSNEKVRIINATGQDYEDLVSLLIMQYMGKNIPSEDVKAKTDSMISELNNNNILNLNEGGEFLGRISSINAIKEISAIDIECTWSIGNVPSISHGSSKFFCNEGDNLVVLNNVEDNRKLVEKFITYVITNNSDAVKYVTKGDFFSCYLYTYKNKDIEVMPNNFEGNSPIIILNNIEEKSNTISDYNKFIDIKKTYTGSN
ncbi:extracellular solute-binding protein [uncultured Clostridium sp.]|uniref:extracellular solute-binding protein n=1 Tax=uncultured Clostridium sp. TaxID=59620 RepID=UPI0025DBB312|nr:extracellular solute-binding protein [uncultured Clostridium sp.]